MVDPMSFLLTWEFPPEDISVDFVGGFVIVEDRVGVWVFLDHVVQRLVSVEPYYSTVDGQAKKHPCWYR